MSVKYLTYQGKMLKTSDGAVLKMNIPDENQPVLFYDYDGTLLFSYTLAEAQALTALPTPPDHSDVGLQGLTFQRWTHTLAQVNALSAPSVITALYYTTSGRSEFERTFNAKTGLISYLCYWALGGTYVKIYWIDGTSNNYPYFNVAEGLRSHTYAADCDGIESIETDGLLYFRAWNAAPSQSMFKGASTESTVRAVYMGNHVIECSPNPFYGCLNLEKVAINGNIKNWVGACFYNCKSLKHIARPYANDATSFYMSDQYFNNCYNLKAVTLDPRQNTRVPKCTFGYCHSLAHTNLSDTLMTAIGETSQTAFRSCYNLSQIHFPATVATFSYTSFYDCPKLVHFDFTRHTSVPTATGSSPLGSLNALAKIYVPAALYDDWIVAPNWSSYASQIVGV